MHPGNLKSRAFIFHRTGARATKVRKIKPESATLLAAPLKDTRKEELLPLEPGPGPLSESETQSEPKSKSEVPELEFELLPELVLELDPLLDPEPKPVP